jgi:signal transduction histidine kinase/FixJ family two-component response regulator
MTPTSQWGLRNRLMAGCVVLVLCTGASVATVLIVQSYLDAMGAMRESALIHSCAMSRSLEPALLLNDRRALQNIVEAAGEHGSVIGAVVVGLDDQVRAAFVRGEEFEWPPDPMHTAFMHRDVHRKESLESKRGDLLQITTPIWPAASSVSLDLLDDSIPRPEMKPIAYLHISHSLAPIKGALLNRMLTGVLITLCVTGIGVVLTAVAVRHLLGPLRDLVTTTSAIAQGDFSRRASEHAMGELGTLARMFNAMAGKLQRSYQSIERKVSERTAELNTRTRELERAMHAANAASQAKSEFLANMSHEIRTPMTAILGFSENLFDESLSDTDRQEAIAGIHRNGQHLLGIINDILDLSKIEAGHLEIEYTRFSPVELVDACMVQLRERAESKGLTLMRTYEPPLPATIESDPTKLRQILVNLLGNAIKFTERGSIELRCRLELNREDRGNAFLRFDVIDSGIGMTSDQIARVFEPFTQADSTTSRRFGGTGLGLSICKRLSRLLGGNISARSEPGKGSTFTARIRTGALVDVPLLGANELEPHSSEPPPRSEAAHPTHPSSLNCRILLAEDGPDNQKLISFILRKAGADVAVADNGRIALETALAARDAGAPFDVILMDMQMPVMDGYSATRALRDAAYRGAIIALTAHAMSSDRDKCLAAGCDAFATKPVNRAHLIELIAAHLGKPVGQTSTESEAVAATDLAT